MAADQATALPPRVSGIQWILALLSLALAGASYSFSSYEDMALFAGALTVLNLALLANVLAEALRTRVMGKALLIGGTLVFFWLEALTQANWPIPFETPSGVARYSLISQFAIPLVQKAYVYVALFQLMLLAGYGLRPRAAAAVAWVRSRVDMTGAGTPLLYLALGACALVPLLVMFDFDLGRTQYAVVGARSKDDIVWQDIGFVHYLYFLGMFGAALLLARGLLSRDRLRLWYILAGALAAVPFVMLGSARHTWLYVALPSVVIAGRLFLGSLRPGRAIAWGMLALGLLAVVQLQFTLRDRGWDRIGEIRPSELLQTATTGQFSALLYAEYLVPDTHEYFLEPAEPYFVTHFIPRRFWREKKFMQSWVYYNQQYTNGQAYNVTPSVVGQFHMSWGPFGVAFIGVWLGLLTYLADRFLLAIDVRRQWAMAAALGFLYAFVLSSFRIYYPIYFVYLAFGTAAMLVLTRRARTVGAVVAPSLAGSISAR